MGYQFLRNAEFYIFNVVAVAASLKQTKGIFVFLKLLVFPEFVYCHDVLLTVACYLHYGIRPRCSSLVSA